MAVVEDHRVIAESLVAAINAQPDLHCVGTAATVAAVPPLVAGQDPAVVVMDYQLPDGTGAEATRLLHESHPQVAVLLLTAHDALDVLAESMSAGCAAFLPKTVGLDELMRAIHTVAGGGTVFDPDMLAQVANAGPSMMGRAAGLSPREREVLELLTWGLTTREIASRLFVSVHTVRNHVRNITAKLGVGSKVEAVAVALRDGLVDG